MTGLVIEAEAAGLRVLDGGDAPLYGGVSFVFDGARFPAPRWTDLVGSVLSTTTEAMRGILDGGEEGFTYFFEGSYYVYYRLLSRADWTLHAEADHEQSEDVIVSRWEGVLRVQDVLDANLRAIEDVLAECERRQVEGLGVDVLRRTRDTTAALMRRLGR